MSPRSRRTMQRASRSGVAACLMVVLGCVAAFAYWATAGAGSGAAATTTVEQAHTPVAAASGSKVALSWSPSTLANGVAVTAYDVLRHDGTSTVTVCSAASSTSCFDNSPAAAAVRYGVVARMGSSWTGPESDLSAPFTFDTAAPATIISRDPVEPTSTWHTSDVQVTLTASDGTGSGVKEIHYRLNGGPEQVSTANPAVFTVSREDANALQFWAIDNAGNVEDPHQSATVKLDKTAPRTTASVTSGTAGSNGWYRSAVTVTLAPVDESPVAGAASSGVAKTEYQLTTSTTAPASWSGVSTGTAVSVTAQGTSYLWARSTDTAGNVEVVTTPFVVKIDSIAPSVQATPSAPANGAGWWKSDVTVTMVGSDTSSTSSGVTRIEYQTNLNGGPFGTAVTYDASTRPVVSTEGTTIVNARATDAAGNTGSFAAVLTVKLDKTSPTAPSITVTPSAPDGSNGWYRTSPTLAVTGGTDGGGSGVGSYEYQVNGTGGSWLPYSTSVVVPDSPSYQFFARVLDLASNFSSAVNTSVLKVDTAVPSITSIVPAAGTYTKGAQWPAGTTGSGQSCAAGQVCVDATDSGSTIASVTYTFNGGAAQSTTRSGTAASGTWKGTASHTLPNSNKTTVPIVVTVTDVAGNVATETRNVITSN